MNATANNSIPGLVFRTALFAAAASLAAYIPYKYATQLHAISGLYAFMFPLSSLLAAAGIILAVKPEKACDCGVTMRGGAGALSILWMATGLMCGAMLTEQVLKSPLHGSIATFHMIAQHVFLSLSILAFTVAPQWMAMRLAVPAPRASTGIGTRGVQPVD